MMVVLSVHVMGVVQGVHMMDMVSGVHVMVIVLGVHMRVIVPSVHVMGMMPGVLVKGMVLVMSGINDHAFQQIITLNVLKMPLCRLVGVLRGAHSQSFSSQVYFQGHFFFFPMHSSPTRTNVPRGGGGGTDQNGGDVSEVQGVQRWGRDGQ